jgi:hypothetical protein
MPQKFATVQEYLSSLPEDRREALEAIRRVVNANRDKKLREGIQYNVIGWFVPHSLFPAGYHCDPSQPLPFAGLASQKSHIGLYMMCTYVGARSGEHKKWLEDSFRASGKKLDMGAACIRFKKLADVPLDIVGQAFARVTVDEYIGQYTQVLAQQALAKKTKGDAKKTAKPAAKTIAKKASGKPAGKAPTKAAKKLSKKAKG